MDLIYIERQKDTFLHAVDFIENLVIFHCQFQALGQHLNGK